MGSISPGLLGGTRLCLVEVVRAVVFPSRKYWTHSSFWKSGTQGAFSIADSWPGLPAVIDSAFQDVLTKRVFFFAGEPCPDPVSQHHMWDAAWGIQGHLTPTCSTQGGSSGCSLARMQWAPVGLRSWALGRRLGASQGPCSGDVAKCCSSVGSTTGGEWLRPAAPALQCSRWLNAALGASLSLQAGREGPDSG